MDGKDQKGKFVAQNLFHLLRSRVGRPRLFESPEELASKVMEYFEWSNLNDKGKYTSAGLRFYCGLTRSNWFQYKQNPDFCDTLDYIETLLEDFYEKKLQWAGSTQGAIFWLKNKAGWKDESTQTNLNQSINADFGQAVQSPSEPGVNP